MPWPPPTSLPSHFRLSDTKRSCAARSLRPPSAPRSSGTISFSTAPSLASSLRNCSSQTRIRGWERSRRSRSMRWVSSRARWGAAIFGHYGDRIGRKSTLIATLLLMGLATFAVALVPTYESIGIWGAVLLTILRFIQGVGVGGGMGRLGTDVDGMGALRSFPRIHCLLAAVRRALRALSRQPRRTRVQPDVRRAI